jgi:DNA-binding NarL/FixJ family response regulator
MTKIIIIDDHQLIIDGILLILKDQKDIQIIDYSTSGDLILKRGSVETADLALVDIEMPEMDGFALTEKFLKINPSIKILVLTMHKEQSLMKKMIELGASGYVLKNSDRDVLLSAIKQVSSGRKVFDSELLISMMDGEKKILHKKISSLSDETLTSREKEILIHLAQGLSSKDIAEKMFISPRTVDTHRTNIMNKLDIHNVAGLIRYAFQSGIISV